MIIAIIFLITLFLNVAIYLIMLGLNFIGLSYLLVYIGAITVLVLFIVMMISTELIQTVETGKKYSQLIPFSYLLACLALILFALTIPSFFDFGRENYFIEIYSLINKAFLNLQQIINDNPNTAKALEDYLVILYSNQSYQLEGFTDWAQFLDLNTTTNFVSEGSNFIEKYNLLNNDFIIRDVVPSTLLHKNLQIQTIGQTIYGHYAIILLISSILLLLAMLTPIMLTSNQKQTNTN